ncbi:MAG TPA: ThiF family adenylyltransferase [Streptosporangiaceae bacterium]|nr:ThiF family adenylyltransferase [Streptosporangiaceae bacterium]HVB44673.1 ThiF family adenylyltransferase [Streptosporangiaceae bacterium]
MSSLLARPSPDLQRLHQEGYDIEIRSGYLLVKRVPFATSAGEVAFGTLISELSTSGTATIKPATHVVSFAGGIPCDNHGNRLSKIINSIGENRLADGITADCTFSSKPPDGYPDYYAKMTAYANMISGWAQAIDPKVTARSLLPVKMTEDESVFRYLDSASSRAQIGLVTGKLALPRVAIVGVGGTGAYVLDQLAKTPVGEIHLFDGDTFYAHNAFRAPGAASVEELDAMRNKAEYHRDRYDAMRRGIIAHPYHVDESNIGELQDMAFVFLTMDPGPGKKFIVEKLEQHALPFIDTGMGVRRTGDTLRGIVTATTSTPGHREHVWANKRITFADGGDEYDHNIQIADLNMLNAVFAVIKWKKLYGFYADDEHELFTAYTIAANQLLNDDQPS